MTDPERAREGERTMWTSGWQRIPPHSVCVAIHPPRQRGRGERGDGVHKGPDWWDMSWRPVGGDSW
jgi:hypothetical protein